MWREIIVWAIVLAAVFIFGQLWFHVVDGSISKIKSLFGRSKEPQAWHSFEDTEDERRN